MLTYADVWATMETAGAGGRELGRRFTDSAGSRRQEQARGQNSKLSSQGREQPRMDSTGRRQERAAGSRGQQEQQAGRESRTAGRHGRRAGQTRTAAGAAGGTTSLFPLHKYICCGIRISSDNAWLLNVIQTKKSVCAHAYDSITVFIIVHYCVMILHLVYTMMQ